MNKVAKTCYIAMSNLFLHLSFYELILLILNQFVLNGRKSILKGFAPNRGTRRLF